MTTTPPTSLEDLDVLIIGAGISGVGAAYNVQTHCPQLSFGVVEARADLGGTWDLFKYPGIRSDSDLFTFGYDFNPWREDKAIADGPSIKAYIASTVDKYNLGHRIHFKHRVVELDWQSETQRWQVILRREDDGATFTVHPRWIFNASGYYRYDRGFAPHFPGQETFAGPVIHPQHWPQDLDYENKRVVVIGSGATALTMVPAMAPKTAHITMLQRTPTYVLPVPEKDWLATKLRPLIGDERAFRFARRSSIAKQAWFYNLCQKYPKAARALIRWINRKVLPKGYDVDKHFNPPYDPWDQRLCAVPGGDLFKAISAGTASVVTDQIDAFTTSGIQLKSGEHLDADIIVTATGLNLAPLGDLVPKVDGKQVTLSESIVYKGMLLSGIPNFAIAVGYTSSSWTLKIGLLCEHFTRLLNHMSEHGLGVCTPTAAPDMETAPVLNFGAGYVQRSMDKLPRQGDRFPWSMSFNYAADVKIFRRGRIDDPALAFETLNTADDGSKAS